MPSNQTNNLLAKGWQPERSKIKAAIENGLSESYLKVNKILYLGAAHGYTITHLYDQYTNQVEIYAVEKSPEMMRAFMPVVQDLPTVLPVLADANAPDSFAHYIDTDVDVVFQDIAQKDQVGIFLANCKRFLSTHGVGLLALKAPAVNSSAEPAAIFAETRERLEQESMTVVQEISLEPHQKHHRLYVVHPADEYAYF